MKVGVERHHDGGQLGGGVGMGQAAAERAPVADLRVGDVGHGGGQQGRDLRHLRAALETALAGHGADLEPAAVGADVGQLGHAVEVDQRGGLRQAEVHRRDQALAAGEELAVVGVFGEERERLVGRGGGIVLEWCRFHAGVPVRCSSRS